MSMSHKRIAVCIPTYNQSSYLPSAVKSCLSQAGVDVEVWVSDDASTDETKECMQVFDGDERVRFHRNESNLGIAANAGWVMEQPQTEYLVRLDSDDWLLPEYCQTLVGFLEKFPNAAVAHGAVVEIGSDGSKRRVRRLARSSGFQDSENALKASKSGYRVAANICMFRTDALRSLRFVYRPGMNFAEDWDLFARLAAKGFGNAYSTRTIAKYRVWSDQQGYRNGRKAQEVQGLVTLFRETLGPAWEKRHWDLKELQKARLALALNHAKALLQIPDGTNDFATVHRLLILLSGGEHSMIDDRLTQLRGSQPSTEVRKSLLKRKIRDSVKAILFR